MINRSPTNNSLQVLCNVLDCNAPGHSLWQKANNVFRVTIIFLLLFFSKENSTMVACMLNLVNMWGNKCFFSLWESDSGLGP